jgi:hypothetical protein
MADDRVRTLATLAASMGALLGAIACSSSTGDKSSDVTQPSNSTDSGKGNVGPDSSLGVADDAGDDGSDGDDGGDGGSTCQSGNYIPDIYTPGMKKIGKPASGDPSDAETPGLTFTLVSDDVGDAATGPAEPYTNTFTLALTDSSGHPVTDANVLLPTSDQALGWIYSKDPWMPLHGHGSSVATKVTNNNDGTYSLEMYFFMPGFWQIYIVAEAGPDASTPSVPQAVTFQFCLE